MPGSRQDRIALLLLVGGGAGDSPVESAVRAARRAAGRDLLEMLLGTGRVGPVVVATDDPAWAASLRDLPVTLDLDPPGTPFHFGSRVAALIDRYQLQRVLYAGGGSAPLMRREEWLEVLARVLAGGRVVVTNNVHSSDWLAFSPAGAVQRLIARQGRDNGLAWLLAQEAGFQVHALSPTASSRFDLDTPADLLIARAHPGVGSHLRAALQTLDWPSSGVEGVLDVMGSEGGHLMVIGRSSASAWAALERQTQCWVRVLVEERGMIASGRLARGQVRSLVNAYLEQVGVEGFFSQLASLAQAVLLDSRVIMGARGLWPSPADRFNADLLRWQEVSEPFTRAFSRAASEAGISVLLGGQSVVAGGLMALLEVLAARSGDR
jgi:hypothetical protein